MAFRPEWYQNDQKQGWRGGGGWRHRLRHGSAFQLIVVVTLAVWLLQILLDQLLGGDPLGRYLSLRTWWPSGDGVSFNLLFPVQLVTYMLVHATNSVWHVGMNMLFLYFFGRELEATYGKQGLLRLYLAGGVLGGLAMWISGFFDAAPLMNGDTVHTLGASGAVYAIMVLYALKWPRRTILILMPFPIPVPVILMVGFKVASDLNGVLAGGGGTAYLAHLGGALVGYLWFRQGDIVGRAQTKIRSVRHERSMAAESDDRREMDRILRKIQAEGLSSLSTSERSFLDRRSRELKQRGGGRS